MEFLSKMDFFQEFINRNKKVLIISGACSLVGITGLSLTALKLYRKFQNLYVPYVISNKHTYRVNVAIGLCYSYAVLYFDSLKHAYSFKSIIIDQ